LPSQDEGCYDELAYMWRPHKECTELLSKWFVERRMTNRVENVMPGEWFNKKFAEWQKDLQVWHARYMEWKDPVKKASLIAVAGAAKRKREQEQGLTDKEKEDKAKKEQREKDDEGKDAMQLLEDELERQDLDVFGVDDIFDLGDGEPLFANFTWEDFQLLSLRFEIHVLIHAFIKDCNDPERTGFPVDHLQFYFNRYYKKNLNPRNFGVETVEALMLMVTDTIVNVNKMLESQLSAELESNGILIMLTEEARRERQERIDAGDESAKLKFANKAVMEQGSPGISAALSAASVRNAPMQAKSSMSGPMGWGKSPGPAMMGPTGVPPPGGCGGCGPKMQAMPGMVSPPQMMPPQMTPPGGMGKGMMGKGCMDGGCKGMDMMGKGMDGFGKGMDMMGGKGMDMMGGKGMDMMGKGGCMGKGMDMMGKMGGKGMDMMGGKGGDWYGKGGGMMGGMGGPMMGKGGGKFGGGKWGPY